MEVLVTAASGEEYDDMLGRRAYLCRPLSAALGDVRSAGQCLAEVGADAGRGAPVLTAGACAELAGAVGRWMGDEKVVAGGRG